MGSRSIATTIQTPTFIGQSTMHEAFWIIAAYLAFGVNVAAWVWEPEMGGWFWVVLFWPLALLARVK